MSNKFKPYSESDIINIVKMVDSGTDIGVIANRYNRSKEAILQVMYNYRTKNKHSMAGKVALRVGNVVVAEVPESNMEFQEQVQNALANAEFVQSTAKSSPVVEKTTTMTPREMIKKLYDMGYRIEDNQLVCYVKTPVNVRDIVKG